MPGIDRIDSVYDIPAIQQEFAAMREGLSGNQKSLIGLYDTIKQFKDTNLGNLATNTDKLTTAISGSVQATNKAKQAYDDLTNRISAQIKASAENANATNQNAQAYDQLIKQSVRNKIALDDLASSQAQLKKAFQAGTSTMEEYESSLSDIKTAQLSLKTSNADITKSLNNLEKQAQASSGSIDHMRATLNLLQQSYDKLNASEKASEGGQGLLKNIQTLDAALKEQEGSTGRNQRKVGDYVGALKILEAELAGVNAKLSAMQATGDTQSSTYAKTAEQAELLNVIVGQQEKGFSSVTQQIRSTERALFSLKEAGLGATVGFEKLREATVEAAQQQKEFARQEKLLESEAPVLGAITLAAKGLAGAYAIGAGSVALFADGNEKVEKELNKLVAIMTILQGLHEAYELIQQSGAITSAIRTALTKASNAVLGENAAITEVATVATTELAAAEGEAAITADAQAVSMEGLAVATEGVAAAEGIATVATEAFGSALLATGIGAAIAAIAVAIIYVLSKIPDWIKGNTMAIKQQGELAEAMKKANEAMIEQVHFMNDLDQASKKYYENQLALSGAAGLNEEKNFALRKALGEEELRLAQDQVDALGASYTGNARLAESIQDLNNKRQEAIDIQLKLLAIPEQKQTSDQKDQLEAAKKNEEFYAKALEAPKTLYEASKKALEERDSARQKSGQDELKEAKFNADQLRKLVLETANIEVDYTKHKNELILGDERSTLDQRLKAMISNAQAERRAIEANKNNVLNDPGASSTEKSLAIQKAAEEERKVTQNSLEEQRKLRREYYIRDRDAAIEAANDVLQDSIKINDEILSKDKARQQERLDLEAHNYESRRAMLGGQLLKDLDNENLTAKERLAITKKYDSDLLTLNIERAKLVEEEQKREHERQLQELKDYYEKRDRQISTAESKAKIKINTQAGGGLFGTESRNKKERDEEFKRGQERLQNQIDSDYAVVNSYKQGTKERIEAEDTMYKHIAELTKNAADKKLADQKQMTTAEINLANGTADLVQAAIDARYTNELNHIQKLIEANDLLKARDLERINSSTLSEQEKANATIILNARVDAQNQVLVNREKKIKHDQAVTDKAFSVAKAIEEGVISTLHALAEGGPVYAAIVGALAAVQIAKIIATPIPAYKEGAGVDGKPVHPGGLALVHANEMIIEPGKSPYKSPGDNVLMDLAAHTRVIPAEKIRQMTEAGMFVNQQGRLVQGAGDDAVKEMKAMKEALIWQTQELKQAMAKQKRVTVIHNHMSNDFLEHITNAVYK